MIQIGMARCRLVRTGKQIIQKCHSKERIYIQFSVDGVCLQNLRIWILIKTQTWVFGKVGVMILILFVYPKALNLGLDFLDFCKC